MTNEEARKILIAHNKFRRGADIDMGCPKQIGIAIGVAIEALEQKDLTVVWMNGYWAGKRSKSAIAQNIRDAAINWPQYLGDVESEIVHAFFASGEFASKHFTGANFIESDYAFRTFLLLVAEELAS